MRFETRLSLPAAHCLFMALFYVASALLSYLLSMIMITISRKVTYQMRSDIFNKLSSLPVGYFDTHQAGDIISRISYDTDTINSSLSTDLVQVLASVITVGGSLGMMITIVGPTGAGKTTLINLLMRFYDKDSGEIKVDGHSIYDLQRKSLRLAYSMVLQDTWLFYGTIYENIAYGKQGITREEVIQAAKAAKIHSYIQRLPQGYGTLLTDDGTNISKGQKQLLTIARAMVMDSPMLILDEATSNVDTRTEMQIQEAMRRLMENKTCFVVAHRLSTIRNADLILVVRDGNVVESGTHEELMKKRGFYRELYEAQFK